MPKIAYVCEACWRDASEMSCWEDREQLRVLPDGTQLCDTCYSDGEWDAPKDEEGYRVSWSTLPMPPEYKPASEGRSLETRVPGGGTEG